MNLKQVRMAQSSQDPQCLLEHRDANGTEPRTGRSPLHVRQAYRGLRSPEYTMKELRMYGTGVKEPTITNQHRYHRLSLYRYHE